MRFSESVAILEKTLADMRTLNIRDDIEGKHELYWAVPADASFNMNSEPQGYDVGNLQDEYDSITRRMARGDIIVPDSFMFLSALFKLAYDLSGRED